MTTKTKPSPLDQFDDPQDLDQEPTAEGAEEKEGAPGAEPVPETGREREARESRERLAAERARERAEIEELRARLTPADVVVARETYRPSSLHALVEFPENALLRAMDERRIPSSRGFLHLHPRWSTVPVSGEDFLTWLVKDGIAAKVTEFGAQQWRKRQAAVVGRTATGQPAVKEPTIGNLLETIAANRVEEQRREEEAFRAEAFGRYVELLDRGGDRGVDDALRSEIEGLLADLAITPEQARQDREIVARAKGYLAEHAQREETRQAMVAARAAREAWQRERKTRDEETERALRRASSAFANCGQAADRLRQLAAQRPELFDQSTDPVSLRMPRPAEE